jgi:ankyrin repeat protein
VRRLGVNFDEAHRRIKRGDIDAIRSALDQGLSPSETNRFGWSLLMLAAIQGTTEIGKLLISSGAALDSANDAEKLPSPLLLQAVMLNSLKC